MSGRQVLVGADRALATSGIDVSGFSTEAERLGASGKSPLYAAIDGRLAAIIAVSDPVKETTPQAIKSLHELGLKVAMITGDNRLTAEAIARKAMRIAADICVYTNENTVIELLERR